MAINLFGFIFVRKEYKEKLENNQYGKSVLLNHELIHTAQYRETLYVLYIPIYLLNYIINLFIYFSFKDAYKNICFEREATKFERDSNYLEKRTRWAWLQYIK